MEFAKKFILVDPSKLSTTKNESNATATSTQQDQYSRLQDTAVKEVYDLDKQLESILKNTTILPMEKVKRYNEVLSRFQDCYKKLKDMPMDVNIVNKNDRQGDESSKLEIAESTQQNNSIPAKSLEHSIGDNGSGLKAIVQKLPKSLKNRGQVLIDTWTTQEKVSVGNNGELVIDGRYLKGSNASELIDAVLKSRTDPTKKTRPPPGWQAMVTSIKSLQLPKGIIRGLDVKRSPPNTGKLRLKSPNKLVKGELIGSDPTSGWLSFK